MKSNRTLLAIAAAAVMASLGATHSVAADKYTIYLSNNFVGNDWRQQMERVAEVSVEQGAACGPRRPQDRERREHRSGADQLAEQHHPRQARRDPDRCRLGRRRSIRRSRRPAMPASSSISFDQMVTEPCAYALESDWDRIPAVLAEWMAKQLERQGQGLRRPRPRRRADLGAARRAATRPC